MKTRNVVTYALLSSLALALNYAESFIPLGLIVPIPGLKLGLSNIVIIFALFNFGFSPAFMILIVKCILSSFFSSGVTSFVYSLTGGILSLAAMAILKRRQNLFSLFGISIAGAAMHNIGQIITAVLLLQNALIVYYLPILLLSSIFTGTITALISSILLKRFSVIDIKKV